jgi:hypothetical protein
LCLGRVGGLHAGPVVGLLRSGEVQVRLFSFSVYLLSVFYFLFESDLNSNLNLQVSCYVNSIKRWSDALHHILIWSKYFIFDYISCLLAFSK